MELGGIFYGNTPCKLVLEEDTVVEITVGLPGYIPWVKRVKIAPDLRIKEILKEETFLVWRSRFKKEVNRVKKIFVALVLLGSVLSFAPMALGAVKPTVIVVGFDITVPGLQYEETLPAALTDLMINALINSNRFRVFERTSSMPWWLNRVSSTFRGWWILQPPCSWGG